MKKAFSVLVMVSLSLAWFVAVFPSPKAYAQPVSSCNRFGSQLSYTLPGSYGKDIMLCAFADQEIGAGNTITSLMWVASSLQPAPSYWTNYNSHLILGVPNISEGTQLDQTTSDLDGTSQWYMTGNPPLYTPFNARTAYCMGVQGGSVSLGARVVQWACNGNSDQNWLWEWTGLTASGWPVWNIVNSKSHMCLGVSAASLSSGAPIVQWDCNGHPDQEWY